MLIFRVYGQVFVGTNGRLKRMTKPEQKKVLREKLREQRASLTSQEVQQASSDVCALLMNHLDVSKGKRLHVYAAKDTWKEIYIAPYVEWIKKQNNTSTVDIAAHMPVQAIPSKQYDIVLVPMLAFDSELRRLGMGMGWYDMFLAKQHHALKIGIAYDWAEMKELIAEDHDVSMDIIVTPTRILLRP